MTIFTNRPIKEHLLRSGGLASEVRDLRNDVNDAFTIVENGASTSVANIAALAALSMTGKSEGVLTYVQTVKDFWMYLPTSTLTVDGITIVAATGGGRHLRLSSTNSYWFTQYTWYVDPQQTHTTPGNDEGDGTINNPLRSYKEVNRRVWAHTGGSRYIVNALSAPALGDPPRFLGNYDASYSPSFNTAIRADDVVFKGSFGAAVVTGTVSASTAASSATNEVWSITDAAITWATYVNGNYFIRFTSGASNGHFAQIMVDRGAGRVDITQPSLSDVTLTTITSATTSSAVTVGTTFEIVQMLVCPELEMSRNSTAAYPARQYLNFYFSGANLAALSPNEGQDFTLGPNSTTFSQCAFKFQVTVIGNSVGTFSFTQCSLLSGTSGSLAGIITSSGARIILNRVGTPRTTNLQGAQQIINSCYLKGQIVSSANTNQQCVISLAGDNIIRPTTLISVGIQLDGNVILRALSSASTLIGENVNTAIAHTIGAKSILSQAAIAAGRYSIVAQQAVVTFDTFGYAVPLPQPLTAPVLQAITALPTNTNLNAINVAPWLLPAIASQMPAKVVVNGADGETKLVCM